MTSGSIQLQRRAKATSGGSWFDELTMSGLEHAEAYTPA